jgi:hypothetical protein
VAFYIKITYSFRRWRQQPCRRHAGGFKRNGMQQGPETKFSSLTFKLLVSNLSAVTTEDGVGFYEDMTWRKIFYHTR